MDALLPLIKISGSEFSTGYIMRAAPRGRMVDGGGKRKEAGFFFVGLWVCMFHELWS